MKNFIFLGMSLFCATEAFAAGQFSLGAAADIDTTPKSYSCQTYSPTPSSPTFSEAPSGDSSPKSSVSGYSSPDHEAEAKHQMAEHSAAGSHSAPPLSFQELEALRFYRDLHLKASEFFHSYLSAGMSIHNASQIFNARMNQTFQLTLQRHRMHPAHLQMLVQKHWMPQLATFAQPKVLQPMATHPVQQMAPQQMHQQQMHLQPQFQQQAAVFEEEADEEEAPITQVQQQMHQQPQFQQQTATGEDEAVEGDPSDEGVQMTQQHDVVEQAAPQQTAESGEDVQDHTTIHDLFNRDLLKALGFDEDQ